MPELPLRPVMQLSVPLLVCAWMFLLDERARLLACGLIVAVALALAAALTRTLIGAALVICLAVFLLRWLPLRDVLLWREIVVLIGVLLVFVVEVEDRRPRLSGQPRAAVLHGIAAAVAVAAVTPVITTRGLLFPFVVAGAVMMLRSSAAQLGAAAILLSGVPFVRYSFAPMLVIAAVAIALPLVSRIPVVPHAAALALFALWPWSGLLARSFPAFLRATHPSPRQQGVGTALEASRSVSFDVPEKTRTIVVTASGANASRLRPGTLLGSIDAIGRDGEIVSRDIRIGDVADFGFMRREQFLHSRNCAPRVPTGDIRGLGATAWLYGAGRVAIRAPHDIASVRITAADGLRRDARLQVESIDFE